MNIAQRFVSTFAAFMVFLLVGCASTSTREGTGEYIDDTVITSKIKAAFAADPTVKATEVKVETFKGTVQLSGFVDDATARARAVEVAKNVEGVKNVKNDLALRNKTG